MATIDELMEGKVPGSVRVTHYGWDNNKYFTPYFKSQNKWYGLSHLNTKDSWVDDSASWQLYTGPKKKVVRWLWAYKNLGIWYCYEFYSEEEAVKAAKENPERTMFKVELSRTEFEE